MPGLLAFVANSFTLSLGGTVAGNMPKFATYPWLVLCKIVHVRVDAVWLTVVALLTLGAVTGHVTEATAGIAGLLPATKAATVSATIATALGTAASNVSNLAALVALLTADRTSIAFGLRTFTREMTYATATVARFLLGGNSAFPAYMFLKKGPC